MGLVWYDASDSNPLRKRRDLRSRQLLRRRHLQIVVQVTNRLHQQTVFGLSDDDRLLLKAGSAVIGPNGAVIAGPDFDTAETLYADLDLDAIADELMTLDTDGHYSRPDVFTLTVDTSRHTGVVFD